MTRPRRLFNTLNTLNKSGIKAFVKALKLEIKVLFDLFDGLPCNLRMDGRKIIRNYRVKRYFSGRTTGYEAGKQTSFSSERVFVNQVMGYRLQVWHGGHTYHDQCSCNTYVYILQLQRVPCFWLSAYFTYKYVLSLQHVCDKHILQVTTTTITQKYIYNTHILQLLLLHDARSIRKRFAVATYTLQLKRVLLVTATRECPNYCFYSSQPT